MHSKALVFATMAASVAALELLPGHNALKRHLMARQTDNPSAVYSAEVACATALQSAYASLPTPPADLVSYEETVSVTDPCHFTYPASISSELVQYESSIQDWYSSNSAAIQSALSLCPQYSTIAGDDGVSTAFSDVCATTTGAAGAKTTDTKTTDTKTTGTATGAGTAATDSTTTSSKNAGPRETAAIGAAALAVAGVLGVVAAM